MKILRLISILLICLWHKSNAGKIIVTPQQEDITLHNNISYYEDKTKGLNIDDIQFIKFDQIVSDPEEINFGHSNSTFWFKFTILNQTENSLYYILGIENSNIDEVDFYELQNNKLAKSVKTGESKSTSTRDLKHRHFLNRIHVIPNIESTVYIRINNNGDEVTVPIILKKSEEYFERDEKQLLILGLYNGLFLMIFIFILFLYFRFKDPIYLYYSLYVAMSTLFVLGGDGLLSFLLSPYLTVRIKLTFLNAGMFFLINLTQSFYKSSKEDNPHFPFYFNILKIIAVVSAFLTYLPYPYRLSSIYITTVSAIAIFITVVLVSIILYKKEYYTSLYTAAFCFSLLAVIIYILYDYGYLVNNLLTENSLRLGKTIEGIFLTLAVVERFKYIENQDKILIKDRSEKIEHQKEILQNINRELEKLSIVASETDNAIAIYDEEEHIEWCNMAFERLYESSMQDVIKNTGEKLNQISNQEDIDIIIRECKENKKSMRYQSKRRSKSGKEIWTQTTLTPYVDKNGKIIKFITVDTNITRLKEIQKELIISRDRAEESDKLKSAFLSNISHEIRTPLNAILGFSELILMDRCDESKKTKYLHLVRNNGRHLLKLISDIIDISRIEAGEIKLDLFKGNINHLLLEIYEHYKVEIDSTLSKDIELKYNFDLSDDESNVFADHHKIRQIITNLLTNALKFTLNGYIELGYVIEKGKIRFYIKDTGIGIEETQQKVIFERFRQVELGLSRKFEGAGLGLTLSKGLVEKMGGKIWVDSEIGKGSTFSFIVPYEPIKIEKTSQDEMSKEIIKVDLKGKKILIVEDTAASRELIYEMLEDSNATITEVENGADALKMARENDYDIILMDIRLPDISGYDVTRNIREFNKKVCIIAQTANAMDDEKQKCFEAGCNDYISKPFDSNSLLSMIEKQLNHK